MKVSELIGAELDYWVAKAERELGGRWYQEGDGPWVRKGDMRIFCPSIHWEQGGPIIEREHIGLDRPHNGQTPPAWRALTDNKVPSKGAEMRQLVVSAWGESALIAAMRAYVASKFGDEVTE